MEETTTESVETQANTGADDAQPVQEPDTAVQTKEETSTETQETDDSTDDTQPAKQTTDDDAEFQEWVKKKGLPLSENPTENELKLAKMQWNAEGKMHEATKQKSELKNAITEEVHSNVDTSDETQQIKAEVAVLRINQALNDFYEENPDAREYDGDMAQLVQENPNYAQGGLEALYALAKHRKAVNEAEGIKKDGAREALENVALKQQAASPVGHATNKDISGSKVTPEQVRKKLQEGDKDWIRANREAIDAL